MKARDDGSFETFASRALPRLLRTAWLLTGDPTRAEDAAQEALVRLYVVWPRVRREEPEAYCHRILRNHVVSTWRKDQRLVLVDEVRDTVHGARADDDSSARLDLVRALSLLPTREREVVVLRHYADLSERTVAELLGVSVGTVKSSSSRGLERLRTLISDKGKPMSSDLDIIELLRTEAAPPMHVDLGQVVAQGRWRTRRRAAGVAVAACAAVVAALAVGSTLLSPGNDTTTPAGTTSTSPGGADRATGQPTDPGLSGRHALTVGDARYTMSVGNGLLTIDVVRGGQRESSVAGLVGSGGAWRVIDGTEGRQVVTGIVPGVAGAIELHPVLGHTVPEHTVALAPGRDFTAFVVTFAEPLDELTPAADIGWSAGGPATSWILGSEPQMAAFGVTMAGEGETPLPPSDFTRTGPATTGAPASVVISIDLPDARIGGSAVATLQGDLVVKDPSRLSALLLGRDPETSLARGSFQLTDGRTFVWGVAPAGTTGVVPQVAAGAKVGKVVLAPMMGAWTAYAVEVEGSDAPPTGLEVTLGGGRGGFSVIE